MKNFLAIYTGSAEAMVAWNALSESERQARTQQGIAAWHAWGAQHRARIVDDGGPLGRTKRIDASGVADIRNAMMGYTILRAESYADAAALFEQHPHFTIFPGDGVEIMECLPIPEMGA